VKKPFAAGRVHGYSGYPVSVVNPAKINAFAKSELSRAKTDKADAKLIARYASITHPAAPKKTFSVELSFYNFFTTFFLSCNRLLIINLA